ncbi:MAG TPA: hypothetical protein VD736_01645 [Nitrososphaera sp.]|nr:hypothetical protein [Nitrososphaera sp.]
MGIKVIKEKKARDYTFVDDALNLEQATKRESDVKKDRAERDFRLRDNTKNSKLRHRSKVTGGQGMQGHSPVYE